MGASGARSTSSPSSRRGDGAMVPGALAARSSPTLSSTTESTARTRLSTSSGSSTPLALIALELDLERDARAHERAEVATRGGGLARVTDREEHVVPRRRPTRGWSSACCAPRRASFDEALQRAIDEDPGGAARAATVSSAPWAPGAVATVPLAFMGAAAMGVRRALRVLPDVCPGGRLAPRGARAEERRPHGQRQRHGAAGARDAE